MDISSPIESAPSASTRGVRIVGCAAVPPRAPPKKPGTSETSRFLETISQRAGPDECDLQGTRAGETLASLKRCTPAQRDLLESMYRNNGSRRPDFSAGPWAAPPAQPTIRTPRVLADAPIQLGLLMSMSRVYVNEGSGWNAWVHTMALNPFRSEREHGARLLRRRSST